MFWFKFGWDFGYWLKFRYNVVRFDSYVEWSKYERGSLILVDDPDVIKFYSTSLITERRLY